MIRKLLSGGIALLIVIALASTLPDGSLSFESLRDLLDALRARASSQPLVAGGLYVGIYVAIALLNLPGAFILTPAAGALFGTFAGTALASFASALGATLSFLAARFLFRDFIERRFRSVTDRVNRGIQREGLYYLFALRLVPIFPFFVINPVMGVTRLRTWTFYWVSQLGMLPGTFVYVNAGTQLGRIDSVSGVLTPGVLGSFALLAVFPFVARAALNAVRARRLYARFRRPARYDANIVILGAGPDGRVAARIAADARAKVIVVDTDGIGGDARFVPGTVLAGSAAVEDRLRRAADFRLANAGIGTGADGNPAMNPLHTIAGVGCVAGLARLASPWSVEVGGRTITARSIVLAMGAAPAVPDIPGLETVPQVTPDSVWELAALPEHLLVLGGGTSACEFAQAFSRLGSRVTLVDPMPRLLVHEDEGVSSLLAAQFAAEGIEVVAGFSVVGFQRRGDGGTARCLRGAEARDIDFDMALIALGRTPRTAHLGLESLGIELNPNGTVSVNEYLQTHLPNVYACGAVAGPLPIAHAGTRQAAYCAMNALWGRFYRRRAEYSAIPWAVFTDPEIGRIGLTESEARAAGHDVEAVTVDLPASAATGADPAVRGWMKVVTPRGRDEILGVTIAGPRASDRLGEMALAMRHGAGLRRLLRRIQDLPARPADRTSPDLRRNALLSQSLLAMAERWNRRQLG